VEARSTSKLELPDKMELLEMVIFTPEWNALRLRPI
jgi:hypothetical protein